MRLQPVEATEESPVSSLDPPPGGGARPVRGVITVVS
jgi:hypothetical protein